jgi:hypothetical protein
MATSNASRQVYTSYEDCFKYTNIVQYNRPTVNYPLGFNVIAYLTVPVVNFKILFLIENFTSVEEDMKKHQGCH